MSIKLTLTILCALVVTAMGGSILKDGESAKFHTVKVPGGCYHFEGSVTCDAGKFNSIHKNASVELYQKRDVQDSHLKQVTLETKYNFHIIGESGVFEFDACVKADKPGDDFEIYYLFERICGDDDQYFAIPFWAKIYRVQALGHGKIIQG